MLTTIVRTLTLTLTLVTATPTPSELFIEELIAQGATYTLVRDARVTEYVPEWGGINCMEPCHLTGYLTPIIYGTTAACGLSIPWNTSVHIFTPWGKYVRYCQDHGGGIDDDEVDVAVLPADHPLGLYGYWDVVWVGWPTPPPVQPRRHRRR